MFKEETVELKEKRNKENFINCRRLKHKIFIRDIEVQKLVKLYNTMDCTSFYFYILRKII